MKGLKLTQIRSDGFVCRFSRYQISEHHIVPSRDGKDLWCRGEILYHFKTWKDASTCFNASAPDYQGMKIKLGE